MIDEVQWWEENVMNKLTLSYERVPFMNGYKLIGVNGFMYEGNKHDRIDLLLDVIKQKYLNEREAMGASKV